MLVKWLPKAGGIGEWAHETYFFKFVIVFWKLLNIFSYVFVYIIFLLNFLFSFNCIGNLKIGELLT